MANDLHEQRRQAHAWLDQLPAAKLSAVHALLAVIVDDGDEELSEDDKQALRASNEYFRNGGRGVPLERVVTDLGFTLGEELNPSGTGG